MRAVTNSDSDDVLSGRHEPPDPRLAAVIYITDRIKDTLDVSCEQCRSRHVWPRSTAGPRGATWRYDFCSDCGNTQNYELDAP